VSRTRRFFLLAVALAGVLGLTSCSEDTGGTAAITVNGESISINDFSDELRLYAEEPEAIDLLSQSVEQQGLPSEPTGTETLSSGLTASLATGRVVSLLVDGELAERDIEVTDEQVEQALTQLSAPQQDPTTGQEAPSVFAGLGEDLQQLIAEDRAAQTALDAALLEENPVDVEPTEEEVAAALAAAEGQTCASVILVPTQEEAAAALARVQAGEDFATVAGEVSLDQTAQQGGDIGCFGEGELGVPELDAELAGLEPGDVGGPVSFQSQGADGSTQQAFIVVESRGAPTEDDVRAQLAAAAEQEAAQASPLNDFLAEQLPEAEVRIASRYGTWDPESDLGPSVVPPEGPATTTTSTTAPAGAIDPTTGLPIDPTTGQPIDPTTGQPIDPTTGQPAEGG
jgi:hypothetical protein